MIVSYIERVYDKDLTDVKREFKSCSGSRFARNYHGVVGDDGTISLVEDTPTDIYAEIQANAPSVDINLIVARFMKTGDPTLFERRKGFFMDVTELPETYADFLSVHNQAVDIFDALPVEDRKKFDFDVNKFIASFGTKEFLDVFESRMSSNKSDSVSEVESGEVSRGDE